MISFLRQIISIFFYSDWNLFFQLIKKVLKILDKQYAHLFISVSHILGVPVGAEHSHISCFVPYK